MSSGNLLPPGTDIDLDNCAREPIHIPGSIQPRGVLFVVEEPSLTIQQVSANVADVLDIGVDEVLGQQLERALGTEPVSHVRRAVASFSDLRERNPIEVVVDVRGESVNFDVILHREPDGVMLVEVEAAYGPRPFSFPNTYLAVRGAVGELNRAAGLEELFEITARSVRELTGFDRVMVYRYDADYNGEVVAEAKREDLNSFMGLHYPASDIPAQARALYEKNWIRLISDIDYTPSPVVPVDNPLTGAPLDLTFATLRSVSPIHVEYLKNMGVGASMSISLLRDGKLWGLIACHHYSGSHTPPYGTRAAAEFLGSALSLRLVARHEEDELREQVQAQAVLGKLGTAMLDNRQSVVESLYGGGLAELVEADSVVVRVGAQRHAVGPAPTEAQVDAIAALAAESADLDVVATDSLAVSFPEVEVDPTFASGALIVPLPDGQFVAWFRAEEERAVDWGGDPRNKAIAVQEGDSVRISPRKSFERWRETVRGRSRAWTATEVASARQLRGRVVDSLYERARDELRLAERLQRSLLPPALTTPVGWELSAHYEPAAGGQIGGDWYDAFELPGGSFAAVLGDVAGHGIDAAGTMAQLRNVLRAHLFEGLSPAESLTRMNAFAVAQLGRAFATVLVVSVSPDTGAGLVATAGHPAPFVVAAESTDRLPVRICPPVGVRDATFTEQPFSLARGQALVMFSDGLVERRGEEIDVGLARLARALRAASTADDIWSTVQDAQAADDATVLALRRR